jgi:hypothetical protein
MMQRTLRNAHSPKRVISPRHAFIATAATLAAKLNPASAQPAAKTAIPNSTSSSSTPSSTAFTRSKTPEPPTTASKKEPSAESSSASATEMSLVVVGSGVGHSALNAKAPG